MIFFDNVSVCPTPNYYVQRMFMNNQGDYWYDKVISKDESDKNLAASCVQDSKTGDVILKMVNYGSEPKPMKINLGMFGKIMLGAEMEQLAGNPDAENTFTDPEHIVSSKSAFKAARIFDYETPPMSLTVIRIKTN
jgi:alpha-L-arabinofuranosidase